jgi:DNA repair photolyase
VMVAPVVPGLTDHEIPAILEAAARAGAQRAGYIVLRLPLGVAPLFEGWLAQHHPERAKKVVSRLESMRGGALNDPRFGSRMRGEGVYADQIRSLFEVAQRRAGLGNERLELSCEAFRLASNHPPSPERSARVGRTARGMETEHHTAPRAGRGQLDLFSD